LCLLTKSRLYKKSDVHGDFMTQSIRLAFLDVFFFDDEAIRGGMLVTDLDTIPYEFMVTEEIVPNKLQKLLYGKALLPYSFTHLISLPMLKETKEKISAVLVKKDPLLALRNYVNIPVIALSGEDNPIQLPGGEKLQPETIRPISFSHDRKFPADDKFIKAVLTPLIRKIDLYEPFDRLNTAVRAAQAKNLKANEE